jgi:NAD+ kinase
MRIFVLGNGRRPGVCEECEALRPFLRSHATVVVEDLTFTQDLSGESAELTLVLGGDGSILRAARQMGYRQTPVLGVNLGRLGFLADLDPQELRQCFSRVVQGDYRVTQHLMYECEVDGPGVRRTFLGLNEIAFQTGPPFHMMEVNLVIDGEGVTQYSGDGLILSTPIGSTAHSLAAGGPILSQELGAFVITPICPHTLTNRPLVDSADKVYTIEVIRAADSAMLVIDGQEVLPLTEQHRVTFRRAPVNFCLVKIPGRTYYQTLHDKLKWGDRPNYRDEPFRPPLRTSPEDSQPPSCAQP